ncbi:pre-rRNA processing protein FTSJ3-like [Elysia marginata]|uniref:Pre-rRNA processing protein FTSJ3-like n=1 Tax=Elysia marginata TaxID=1093978 RepID=A0AAV4EYV1_9GAST|nr:pre-rRNA processing protein FTSJ3-like [Elysia marginata]
MQAELTLHAFKLATEFLRKGGWFITKLFRSKDYDPLMWVFQQLFKTVNATKPQASRNESAEIFVVCQGFIAPDKIDPKFLDPRYVFQEVDTTERPAIDLIHPEKKKRQREGYPEGDYTLFHSLPVTEFLSSEDFMDLLAKSSEIALDSEEVKNHPLTTPEIQECIKDIKVLGKKEIKAVFLWRKKLLKEFEKKNKEQTESQSLAEADDDEEEKDEDEQEEEMEQEDMEEMENLLEQKNQEELAAMKRAKKKVRKAQMKQKMRIDMQMTIPGDRPDIQDDINIFDIRKIRTKQGLSEVEKGDLSHLDKDDIFEDSDDESKQKTRPRAYFDRDVKEYHGVDSEDEDEIEMEEEPEFEEGKEASQEMDDGDNEGVESKENSNPLIIDMGQVARIKQDKQTAWFKKAAFADLDSDEDEDLELEQMLGSKKKASKKQDKKKEKDQNKVKKESNNKDKKAKNGPSTNGFESSENEEEDEDDDEDPLARLVKEEAAHGSSGESDDNSDYDFTDMLHTSKKQRKKTKVMEKAAKVVDGVEIVPATSIDPGSHLDAEGLAIGAAMVQSRKRRRDIVDSAYHRYMFDDQNLPEWFVLDEQKHLKRQRPVSKEEMEEYKLKQKAIDAQPIKKIAEAKARKKQKILKRTEKARKKANAITETVDVSEKEKWQQIKQVYKKAGLLNKTKPSVTYVVAKKGAGRKVRRPAGVKGQFKVVDGRMKKDVRGMKKAEARNSKGKGGKKQSSKGMKKGGHRVRR